MNTAKLRGKIAENNYNCATLSKKLNISAASLSRKLNNKGTFSIDEVIKISNALNLSKDEVSCIFLN